MLQMNFKQVSFMVFILAELLFVTKIYFASMYQKKVQFKGEPEYKESSYRFVIITVYILASLVNGLVNSTFAPIVTIIENAFGTPKLLITFNYLIYPISHAIFSGPVNWCLTKKGLRISYYIASVAMITGIWLRTTLSENNPYVCLLGSLLCGFGYLFVLNSSSKITSNWFRSQIVTSMTFLTVLSSVVSLSLSSILPGLFLNEQSRKEDVISFFRFQAILVTVPFILLAILIKQKPESSPSKAAEMEEEEDHKNYIYILKLLFKNKNYLKMAGSVALTSGVVTAFLGIIDEGLKGLGVKEPAKIITNVVLIVLIFGIIGTVFYSIAVKKTKRYKFFSLVLNFSFFIGYMILCLIFLFGVEQPWQVSLLSVVFGFNYMAIPPFFIVYGAQIAFPVDQASVAGYLIACLHTFGFVLGVILVALLKKNRFVILAIFFSLGAVILGGAFLTTTIHEDLRKDKFQHDLLKKDKLQKFSEDEGQTDSDFTSNLIINSEEN